MIDKEKLIANWDNITAETKAQILQLADKEIKEEYFVPKEREKYYVSVFGVAGGCYYTNYFCGDSVDEYYIEIGNCFRTPEEAMFAGSCDYYTKRFETYVNRHTEKIDWDNDDQSKYYAYYDFKKADIRYHFANRCKSQGTIYASSMQILRSAIADIGEETFLKFVINI
ncbi:MAG: hypothetical protein RSC28_09650 [Bacteroidales bacterium]